MKKSLESVILILFVIVAVVGGLIIAYGNLGGETAAIAPPTSCQFVGTEEISTDTYVCTDKCIVQGIMSIDKPTSVRKVVFRTSDTTYTSGSKIAIDTNYDGILESYIFDGAGTSTGTANQPIIVVTNEGYDVNMREGKVQVWKGSHSYIVYKQGSGADTSSTVKNNCLGGEVCTAPPSYVASFNFCPEGNANFAFCNGASNTITVSTPQTVATEEVLLDIRSTSKSVSFVPNYPDYTKVLSKKVMVKKYDCSCMNQPVNTVCDSTIVGQKYCIPMTSCPAGTNKVTSSSCTYNGRTVYPTAASPYCKNTTNTLCSPFSIDNTKYKLCDGTININQATCSSWNTIHSCPVSQKCYNNDGTLTEGLGGCKCGPNECSLGDRKIASVNSYYECVTVGSCPAWSTTAVDCPAGSVYDTNDKKCVGDPAKVCNSLLESQCISSTAIKSCESEEYGYEWGEATSCPGETSCNTKGNDVNDDICDCTKVDACKLNDIKCLTTSTYSICAKDSVEQNSCFKYRGTYNVEQTQTCNMATNQITQRTDVGCAFPNDPASASYLCDTANLELCKNNQCICNSADLATESDYLEQKTKCNGLKIMKAVKYTAKFNICYNWEYEGTTCGDEQVCTISNNQATCEQSYKDIGIFTASQYKVNEPIGKVNITVTKAIGSNANIPLSVVLFEGTNEIVDAGRVETMTNNEGKVTVNIPYSHPRSGTITIKVVIRDPETDTILSTRDKSIAISKGLKILLNCPISGMKKTDIECTYKTVDSENEATLIQTPSYNIKIKEGATELSYTPVGSDKFVFQATELGVIDVLMTASKFGYVTDTESWKVTIEDPKTSVSFFIANEDFTTIDSIPNGISQLKVRVEEGGNPVMLSQVTGAIKTPSGGLDNLKFTKQSSGDWIASYDFKEKGKNYELKTTMSFSDLNRNPITYNYNIPVIEGSGPDEPDYTLYIVIGVSIAVILLFTGSIIFLRRK